MAKCDEVTRLKNELKQADKNYLDLKNEFDKRVKEAREQGKREGYEEATKRAIEMAVFDIPYICKFLEYSSTAARRSYT